jgi:hypothetical protein
VSARNLGSVGGAPQLLEDDCVADVVCIVGWVGCGLGGRATKKVVESRERRDEGGERIGGGWWWVWCVVCGDGGVGC